MGQKLLVIQEVIHKRKVLGVIEIKVYLSKIEKVQKLRKEMMKQKIFLN